MQYVSRTHHYIGNRRQENNGLGRIGVPGQISRPAPARLVGRTIAIQAGKRVVRKPGVAVENEMWAHLGEDWHRTIPAGAVLATATLAGMVRVERLVNGTPPRSLRKSRTCHAQ